MLAIPSTELPEEIRRQREWILTYDLACNTIVQLDLVHTNGEVKHLLQVNGKEKELSRFDFEILAYLMWVAREDPRRRVLARELVDHLDATLPNGGAYTVDNIYRRVYQLRMYLGEALESSTRTEKGYRFSTPNLFFMERKEKR